MRPPEKPLARDPRNHWRLFWTDKLGKPECPYIRRWVLDLGPLGSVRLHHWYSGDDPRAFHDHPWGFLTLVLWGTYTDWSWPDWVKQRHDWNGAEIDSHIRLDKLHAGSVRWRPAHWSHTVETDGAWTLLWTQPKQRSFGFWLKDYRYGLKFMKHTRYFPTHGLPPCN